VNLQNRTERHFESLTFIREAYVLCIGKQIQQTNKEFLLCDISSPSPSKEASQTPRHTSFQPQRQQFVMSCLTAGKGKKYFEYLFHLSGYFSKRWVWFIPGC
jgi:hypothetical protein